LNTDRKRSDILAEIKKSMNEDFLGAEKELRSFLLNIRDEMDDHLTSINQNTEEVSKFYNHIDEVEAKIDKLNTRLDTMHMMFRQVMNQAAVSVDLNLNEQRLFVMLEACPKYLAISDLAERTGVSFENAEESIMSMTDKGLPLIKGIYESKSCVKLDPEFKQMNRRQRLIKISPAIVQQFENKILKNFFG